MAETTLRETIAEQLDQLETPDVTPEVTPQEVTETPEQTAARVRDEKGRFAPKDAAPQEPKASPAPPPVETPAAAAPEAKRPPSSWKKDYWDDYAKLDPRLQDYIEKRERDFANGVSTYKQEAERAREIQDAIAPFQQELAQNGIPAGQWIQNLGRAHLTLAKGDPQSKLAMFQRLAADYGIPAKLAVQDSEGNWQLMGQVQPTQPQFGPQDIERIVSQKLQEQSTQQTLSQFMAEVPTKYPHFEVVRSTMVGLLQSGLAQDLPSAYEAAIQLPLHAELREQEHQQHLQQEMAQKQEQQKAVVQKARSNAVSVKSATPASTGASQGKKGLRDILSEQVESVMGGGRV